MAEDKQQHPAQATTTAPGPYIPDALRQKIEAHYVKLARAIRAFGKKLALPADITTAITADLKDFLRNDYQGFNLDVAGMLYVNSSLPPSLWRQEVGDDFALNNLLTTYGHVCTLIRLAHEQEEAPEALKPAINEMLQKRLATGGPIALYEWARYQTNYDPDFINEEMLEKAQLTRYTDFLIYAALRFNATAPDLMRIEQPRPVKDYMADDRRRLLVDEIISTILAIPLNPPPGLELFRIGAINWPEDEDTQPAQEEATETQTPPPPPPAQVIADTASTIQKRVLILYQPNTATLAKPIEAKKEDVLSKEIMALHGLQGYKTARPKPLAQIITALSDRVQISPVRVTQTLQALQIIAQDKPDKTIDIGDGNVYYVYNGYTITSLARIVLGTDQPSGPDIKEVFQAVELITTLRIGHDEDHVVGKNKKTGKPITKRYRHFTQFLLVPDIRVELDRYNQEAGDPHLTLQIHRLIPTGRRSDQVVVEDGQRQTIAIPRYHKVNQEELDLARKLFKGDEGVRFYNYLKSAGHIKEPDLMAAVFDYEGLRAAARQKAATLLEEARKTAANALTREEADAITADAKKQADAITQAAEENIKRHRPRDRQRLYGWLQDAVDNFIIKPPKGKGLFSDAKDGSTDGKGRPIKVITWESLEQEKQ